MARIVGINVPNNKRLSFSLAYIYGIGHSNAFGIIKQAKINGNPFVSELGEEEIERIRQIIDKNYKVEGDLKQEIGQNIKRLKDIGSYRGSRHSKNLPSRGQRSKTNARTKRGKKITV